VKPLSRAPKPMPLKVLYTASELAVCIGVSRHIVDELVRGQGMVVYRVGRVTLVPLSEIRDKLEPVWDAICAAEQQRRK
jgi:hypothetical protein